MIKRSIYYVFFNENDVTIQSLGEKDVWGLGNIMSRRIVEKGFNAEEFFPEFKERIEEIRKIQEEPNYRIIGMDSITCNSHYTL